MVCDRVGIIDNGKIVAIDTTENLKQLIPGVEGKVLEIGVMNLKNNMVSGIKSLDTVTSVVQNNATDLRVHTTGNGSIDKIIDIIRTGDGKILNISAVEPTLEDVFLHLTGRAIRDEATEKIKPRQFGGPGRRRARRTPSRTR